MHTHKHTHTHIHTTRSLTLPFSSPLLALILVLLSFCPSHHHIVLCSSFLYAWLFVPPFAPRPPGPSSSPLSTPTNPALVTPCHPCHPCSSCHPCNPILFYYYFLLFLCFGPCQDRTHAHSHTHSVHSQSSHPLDTLRSPSLTFSTARAQPISAPPGPSPLSEGGCCWNPCKCWNSTPLPSFLLRPICFVQQGPLR